MPPPKISVIIPTHNRAGFLRKAVESVLRQDYRPLELVVVDDGSTDATPDLLPVLADEVMRHGGMEWKCCRQPQGGASSARNRGFHLSTGSLVLFLDSDDWLNYGALSHLAGALRRSGARYVHGAAYEIHPPGHPAKPRPWIHPIQYDSDRKFNHTTLHTTHLYERGLLEETGAWNETLHRHEDWEFKCRVRLLAGLGVHVRRWIAAYQHHGEGRLTDDKDEVRWSLDHLRAAEILLEWIRTHGLESGELRPLVALYGSLFHKLGSLGQLDAAACAARRLHGWLRQTGGPRRARWTAGFFSTTRPRWVWSAARLLHCLPGSSRHAWLSARPAALPKILFLTPVVPDPRGAGVAMRAAAVLERLQRRFHTEILLVPSPFHPKPDLETLALWGSRFWILDRDAGNKGRRSFRLPGAPCLPPDTHPHDLRWLGPRRLAAARRLLFRRKYAGIHAFRLSTAPVALALRHKNRNPAWLQLDFDDIESLSNSRQAALLRRQERSATADSLELDAEGYRRLEDWCLPRFDRIFSCSAADARTLADRGFRAAVLPNTVDSPTVPRPTASWGGRLLFIGNLGHIPNADAALWLAEVLMPRLAERIPAQLHVAGRGASAELENRLKASPHAVFHGGIPDAEPLFDEADALLAPLRAGAGTRIKILQAFAHGLPVVSTALGVEGLAAEPGVHFLPAEDADDFNNAVCRLAQDTALRAQLTAAARALQEEKYGPAALAVLDTDPAPCAPSPP